MLNKWNMKWKVLVKEAYQLRVGYLGDSKQDLEL